jgi:DNA invertase Pin-like site-specific DNA recombinase
MQEKNAKRRAALYLRVSTHSRSRYGEQQAYDQRPEVQEAPLRRLAQARGWRIVEVYTDRIGGASERRPALERLLADARRGAFDLVAVWRFDRLSRSVRHFLGVMDELRSVGVDFVSHEQAFDTTTPMGKFTVTMFAALAELERLVIRERVIAGLEHARAHGTKSGRPIGRPRAVFRRDQVVELRRLGVPWREVARRLGVGSATVRRAIAADVPKPSARIRPGPR